jgi:hypothetical protein
VANALDSWLWKGNGAAGDGGRLSLFNGFTWGLYILHQKTGLKNMDLREGSNEGCKREQRGKI